MFETLNGLRLVALDDLLLHEAHDAERLARLRARLEAERVQRNPVIVSPSDGKFLVLDGAHRVHATRDLGHPFILVQVTPMPETPESWAHVIANPRLERLDGMKYLGISRRAGRAPAARIETAEGEVLGVYPKGEGLGDEVLALCELQQIYPRGEVVRRLDPASPVTLNGNEARIVYRSYTPTELVEVVRCGTLLPAGITRFRVMERVLGVRYPLERMRDGDLAERNAELRQFVRLLWEAHRVRRYDEPVVIFE